MVVGHSCRSAPTSKLRKLTQTPVPRVATSLFGVIVVVVVFIPKDHPCSR